MPSPPVAFLEGSLRVSPPVQILSSRGDSSGWTVSVGCVYLRDRKRYKQQTFLGKETLLALICPSQVFDLLDIAGPLHWWLVCWCTWTLWMKDRPLIWLGSFSSGPSSALQCSFWQSCSTLHSIVLLGGLRIWSSTGVPCSSHRLWAPVSLHPTMLCGDGCLCWPVFLAWGRLLLLIWTNVLLPRQSLLWK